jgi:catechol 2,3-dioxygenase-like lactoylglutathione lyase family enzyme
MAGGIDHHSRTFHASLNVADLARSVEFYQTLLGVEPAKLRPDYAKFELADPPLVLSLIPGAGTAGGNLNHAGLRVRTPQELVDIQQRLEAAGHRTQREDGVECCYSRQTKFWISDPDRALWEIYVLHGDIEEHGHTVSPRPEPQRLEAVRSAAPAAPIVWAHRLPDPIPSRIPHQDNTLHEVRLEGSVNLAPGTAHRGGLFTEVLRALRPGAPLHIHGLSADRSTGSRVSLPGPAAAVQHVPPTGVIVDELTQAGFVEIQIGTLSDAHFVVDEVAMREVRISARKPGHRPLTARHQAIYLGPMQQVTDDFGNLFRRGVPTPLNVHDWQMLSKGPASSAFLFLKPDGSRDGGSPAATAVAVATT